MKHSNRIRSIATILSFCAAVIALVIAFPQLGSAASLEELERRVANAEADMAHRESQAWLDGEIGRIRANEQRQADLREQHYQEDRLRRLEQAQRDSEIQSSFMRRY